jgi:hypothetical protein
MGERDWQKRVNDVRARGPQLVDERGLAMYSASNREERPVGGDPTFVRTFRRWQQGRPDRGEPKRVVWSVPAATEEIEIPFEFRDLPVPR